MSSESCERCRVGGVEEGREESSNGRKSGGRSVVNGATTALEEREDVSFVLSEEFVGGVVRLGA